MSNKITSDTRKGHKKATQRLLILSGFVDAALGFLKVGVGVVANSHALIADGIHSFSDLATDIMVWVFNKIGAAEADEDHPYGHAKFETFGTLVLGILLILVSAGLIFDSMQRLLDVAEVTIPAWPALIAALISIAGKEWLYQITLALGNKTNSRLLVANAWHHRSDALSSVIVLIGVGGAIAGFLWLEMLAAMGVALMIAQIGWKLSKQSVEELVDTSLAESYVDQIKEKIEGVEGVNGVHSIRTRRMGNDVLADVHLQVEPFISVSEGHHIGEWATRELTSTFSELAKCAGEFAGCPFPDVVSFGYADEGFDLQVNVSEYIIAHPSCANTMHTIDALNAFNFFLDLINVRFCQRSVDQFLHALF